MDDKKLISVVIPTYNRAKDLKRCLDSLLRQTFKGFEVVVVDNGCTDETPEMVKRYPIKMIHEAAKGVTHLFNVGWRNAQGEIIAFINDDAAAEPSWLENVVDTFEKFKDIGAVGGPTIVPQEIMNYQEMLRLHAESKESILLRIPAWVYENLIMEGKYHEIGVLCESGAYSVGGSLYESTKLEQPIYVDLLSITNVAIKKAVLEEVNGLDENFRFTHGDGDLFIRIREAGYKLIFNPKIVVCHYVNPQGDTRSAYWRGIDHAYFLMKCIKPKTLLGKFKLLLNILYFNLYWIYKSLETKKPGYLRGIGGFFRGIFSYKNYI